MTQPGIHSITAYILTIYQIVKDVWVKNLVATQLFIGFLKAFDSIHRRNMDQILFAYGLNQKNVTAIKIMKVMVCSLGWETDLT